MGKGKYQSTDNTTVDKERGNSLTNTRKLNWNILTITDIFLDQKRTNVCEHTIKMAPCERFAKVPPEWVWDRKGGGMERKIECKSSILITSPTAILNPHINLFCPLDTDLVLISDDFHSIPSITPSSGNFLNVTWHCLYGVFKCIYSFLIEKEICDRWNISIKLPYVLCAFHQWLNLEDWDR